MTPYTPPRAVENQPPGSDNPLELTYELDETEMTITNKQWFYIIVPQGIGAAIINAAANFGIACAMYRTTRKEIRFWPLMKNTIAGDMGITVIIQCILTMPITSTIVRWDMVAGRIEPFSTPWPRGKRGKRSVGVLCVIRRVLQFLSPTQTLSISLGPREFFRVLFVTLLQGFVMSVFYFALIWPLAIAITAPLYGGINMQGTWIPEGIKAVFGGVLGLFMNPLVAALVLGAPVTTSVSEAPKPKITTTTPIVRSELPPQVILPLPAEGLSRPLPEPPGVPP